MQQDRREKQDEQSLLKEDQTNQTPIQESTSYASDNSFKEHQPPETVMPPVKAEPLESSERPQEEEPSEQSKEEEYLDLLLRTRVDFVNYRRRMSQQQGEERIAAQCELLAHLLPVFDDLERALGAIPPALTEHSWVEGLSLVMRRLMTQLGQLGIRQLGTPGEPFDARWHEALASEERADTAEGTVLHVARPGYALGERVIRPAQVIVAQAPSSASDTPVEQAHSAY